MTDEHGATDATIGRGSSAALLTQPCRRFAVVARWYQPAVGSRP